MEAAELQAAPPLRNGMSKADEKIEARFTFSQQ
jgi:hypothetical protein